jgi:hypothetical protein
MTSTPNFVFTACVSFNQSQRKIDAKVTNSFLNGGFPVNLVNFIFANKWIPSGSMIRVAENESTNGAARPPFKSHKPVAVKLSLIITALQNQSRAAYGVSTLSQYAILLCVSL